MMKEKICHIDRGFYSPVPSFPDWKSLLNRLSVTPTLIGDKRLRIFQLCGTFFSTAVSAGNGITLLRSA
jgi:hypothetical protein